MEAGVKLWAGGRKTPGARGGKDGLEIRAPSASRGCSTPALPWMGLESYPLAPRHYKWLVQLGWGPCMQVGETLWSATLLVGCGEQNISPNHLSYCYGNERRNRGDRPWWYGFIWARSDEHSLGGDGVIWI